MTKRFRGRTDKTATAVIAPISPKQKKLDAAVQVKTTLSHGSVNLLYKILAMKRPACSKTEKEMITQYIDIHNPQIDAFGNRVIVIAHKDGTKPKTLFSCHTDTVHREAGKQKIYLDPVLNEVFVDDSNCLGADDGTGVYIMLTMIKNKVPGAYVFHRAEEIGCKGSRYIAQNESKFLSAFNAVIAFDRKGQDEVIIAQSPGIIASDKYGNALCTELNVGNTMNFSTSKLGTITDSGQYYKQIGECINLSVGYQSQHTNGETQSITFLQKLLPRLIAIDWDALPVTRLPGPATNKYPQSNNYYQTKRPTYNTPIKEEVPAKKLANIIMQHPRVALLLLQKSKISAIDIWEAEYEVAEDTQEFITDSAYEEYNAYM